jgi:hypothetical protein
MMRATVPAATVKILVGAIADDRVRELLIELLLNGLPSKAADGSPAAANGAQAPRARSRQAASQPKRGRPTKTAARDPTPAIDADALERRRAKARRYAAKRRARDRTAKAGASARPTVSAAPAVSAAAGKRRGRPRAINGSNGTEPTITPQAFWQHAEKLEPTRPWLAVMREFDVKEAVAQHAYRDQSLPPHIGPMAVTRFLTLPAG